MTHHSTCTPWQLQPFTRLQPPLCLAPPSLPPPYRGPLPIRVLPACPTPAANREQRVWDNNGGADYHTHVEEPANAESLIETVLAAMKRESADTDRLAELRAATRAGE